MLKYIYTITNIDMRNDATREYFIASHPNQKVFYRWKLRRVDGSEDEDT